MVKIIKNPLTPGTIINSWKIISYIPYTESESKRSYYVCECQLCKKHYKLQHKNLINGRSTKCRSCSVKNGFPRNPTGKGLPKKLTQLQEQEILNSSDRGVVLAEKYGVTPQAIGLIRKKQRTEESRIVVRQRDALVEEFVATAVRPSRAPEASPVRVKIPEEFYEIAKANGVSPTTLYNRVERGWEIEKALATPPDHKKDSLRKKSRFYGVSRGKVRTVRVPIEFEEKLNGAIAQSGLTEQDYLTEVIVKFIESQPSENESK